MFVVFVENLNFILNPYCVTDTIHDSNIRCLEIILGLVTVLTWGLDRCSIFLNGGFNLLMTLWRFNCDAFFVTMVDILNCHVVFLNLQF